MPPSDNTFQYDVEMLMQIAGRAAGACWKNNENNIVSRQDLMSEMILLVLEGNQTLKDYARAGQTAAEKAANEGRLYLSLMRKGNLIVKSTLKETKPPAKRVLKEDVLLTLSPDEDVPAAKREKVSLIRTALASTTAAQREAVILWAQGVSRRTAAKMLGFPNYKAYESGLARGKRFIQEHLEEPEWSRERPGRASVTPLQEARGVTP